MNLFSALSAIDTRWDGLPGLESMLQYASASANAFSHLQRDSSDHHKLTMVVGI